MQNQLFENFYMPIQKNSQIQGQMDWFVEMHSLTLQIFIQLTIVTELSNLQLLFLNEKHLFTIFMLH